MRYAPGFSGESGHQFFPDLRECFSSTRFDDCREKTFRERSPRSAVAQDRSILTADAGPLSASITR
jgi:hypothetical protein